MKKIYSKLIILSITTVLFVVLFYLFSTIKSTLNVANRNLSVDMFIKKSSNISKKDFSDYKINDIIFTKNFFTKFKYYKDENLTKKGKSDIFYKENN